MDKRLFIALAAAVLVGACVKPQTENPDNGNDNKPNVDKPLPVIRADAFSAGARAGTYLLPVTVENPEDGVQVGARLETEAEWISISGTSTEGVSVSLTNNFSVARSNKIEISYTNAEPLTVELIQEQWAWPEFDISVESIGPFGLTVNVTRNPGYSGGYFFEVLDQAAFDRYVSGDTAAVGEFAWGDALYQSDLAYLKRLAQEHGHPLDQLFSMLSSMYSKEESITMPYSGLQVDSDYVFIVYGMQEGTAERRTPICFYTFHTGYSSESGLSFTGMAHDVTENYAELHVTPSDKSEYWYMNWASEIQLQSTTLADIMQSGISSAKSLLGRYQASEILCHGEERIQASDLMPGTEYTVVAWGMNLDMEATTPPQTVFTFRTKAYEITDNCTYTIDVLAVEDMDIKVRVTPTNPDTRYYVAFVEKSRMEGYSDEQAAQRIINMESQRIEQHYYDVENLSWANLPGLESGVREIWGRRDEGWTFQPSHDYRIYVFGIDNFGIRSTVVNAIDVTTAEPAASSNQFEVKIESSTWQGLDYTVVPKNEEEYWMPFVIATEELLPYRNADGSLKEKEVMAEIEEYYEDEILYNTYHGTRTLHAHVVPDTRYTILVFGYSGSYTTKMFEFEVYAPAPPLGKSTADFSYTYELFRGEDLSALDSRLWPLADYEGDCIMLVRFNVTDNAKHWYFGIWPPVENFADQGGQYYLMNLDMNDSVPGSAMQDKKSFRSRPWWYGATANWTWVDSDGDIVRHWPWSLSGWAEDEDGNYGPWHYELFIPVPVPKGQESGKYEVGYTQAYNFWSSPAQTAGQQVLRVRMDK